VDDEPHAPAEGTTDSHTPRDVSSFWRTVMGMIVTLWLVFLCKVYLAYFSVGHFAYVNEIFRHARTVILPYIDVELHDDECTLQCLPMRILASERSHVRLEKCFIMAIFSHVSLPPPQKNTWCSFVRSCYTVLYVLCLLLD